MIKEVELYVLESPVYDQRGSVCIPAGVALAFVSQDMAGSGGRLWYTNVFYPPGFGRDGWMMVYTEPPRLCLSGPIAIVRVKW